MAHENREKIDLKANIPQIMSFDPKPFKEGVSQYGNWWGYRVIASGQEKTFFANDTTNPIIQGFIKNGIFSLKLTKVEYGKGFMTKIEPADATQSFSQELDRSVVEKKHIDEDEKWDKIAQGKVRSNIVLECIKLKMPYNKETIGFIRRWTDYSMTGEFNDFDELGAIGEEITL